MAPEWPGTPIGAKNTITRQKGRTPVANKIVDATPGLFRRLLANSLEHIATSKQPVFSHDVLIHGLRVRAITNSEHLIGYWRDNWYSPEEWTRLTGHTPAQTPDVLVLALGRIPTEQEAAYYSRQNDTVVFFNTSYYGQLKSWVLGAVGRKLAVEYGIHSIHGAVVTKDGKGLLYIAPTGTGKSTSTYGVMEFPNTRFHSDDWVYVRYAYPTKDGRRVSPARVLADIRLARAAPTLERDGHRPRARRHRGHREREGSGHRPPRGVRVHLGEGLLPPLEPRGELPPSGLRHDPLASRERTGRDAGVHE
jgi:hypothetical protein